MICRIKKKSLKKNSFLEQQHYLWGNETEKTKQFIIRLEACLPKKVQPVPSLQ